MLLGPKLLRLTFEFGAFAEDSCGKADFRQPKLGKMEGFWGPPQPCLTARLEYLIGLNFGLSPQSRAGYNDSFPWTASSKESLQLITTVTATPQSVLEAGSWALHSEQKVCGC